jgi:putative exosortase-associated protein (TIGR04073 family)
MALLRGRLGLYGLVLLSIPNVASLFGCASASAPALVTVTAREPFTETEREELATRQSNQLDEYAVGGAGSYLGSRCLDFCDMLTFDIGGGLGIEPHIQITRWLQLGLGGRIHGRSAGFITPFWEWKRQWGFYTETSAEFAILPFSFEYVKHRGSFASMEPYEFRKAGLNRPSDSVYRSQRDFWAVTLAYGAILIPPVADAKVEFHPVEFADFFTGLVGVDITHDDAGQGWGFRGRDAGQPPPPVAARAQRPASGPVYATQSIGLAQPSMTKGPFYDESSAELKARKLARGFCNVTMCLAEIPNGMFQEAYRTSPVTGSVIGFGKGLVKGSKRFAIGLWEMVTFYSPGRTNYEPYIEPEVIFQDYLH